MTGSFTPPTSSPRCAFPAVPASSDKRCFLFFSTASPFALLLPTSSLCCCLWSSLLSSNEARFLSSPRPPLCLVLQSHPVCAPLHRTRRKPDVSQPLPPHLGGPAKPMRRSWNCESTCMRFVFDAYGRGQAVLYIFIVNFWCANLFRIYLVFSLYYIRLCSPPQLWVVPL